MTAVPSHSDDGLLTVDELAAAAGLTVRTTRYYASLGLVPPPLRRGRLAYYDRLHVAHLELVRSLQEHGFTLQAIERFVATLPEDAGLEDLALQRAMLTSWSPLPQESLTRRAVEKRAGRRLSDDDLTLLETIGALEPHGASYVVLPPFAVGVELLELDIPRGAMEAASEAIRRNMENLADELTTILHADVLAPYRSEAHSPEDAERLEQTMSRLRRLTLEAVVAGFQRAANAVITRSLARR